MNYIKSISIFSLMISAAICGFNTTPLGAYAEDMSSREIEVLIAKRLQGVSPVEAQALGAHLREVCDRYQFSVSSILSLISAESSFRSTAVSPVGAMGLMQVMPRTAEYIARREKIASYRKSKDLFDPMTNISVGVAYLSYLRDRFSGSHHYLAAYNLGPTKFKRITARGKQKPVSVRMYVNKVHNGVFGIRREAQKLAYAQ